MSRILNILFGCRHELGWPRMRKLDGKRAGEYQVCLKCGKEFDRQFSEVA